MNDRDIRLALREGLEAIPDSLVVEEMGLCQGSVRIDIAVIGRTLDGYEIKSERDTLDRLAAQQEIYSRALDFVTVVTNEPHIKQILSRVPTWWGITEAKLVDGRVCFHTIRDGSANTTIDPFALVQLLWRNETLDALRTRELDRGLIRKPRQVLWNQLIDALSLEDLREVVCRQLRARANGSSEGHWGTFNNKVSERRNT